MDRQTLRAIISYEAPLCVSVYLPTHRSGTETQQDPVRLRNLIGEAEEQLAACGLSQRDARERLAHVRAFADDESHWRGGSEGLALFLSPERPMEQHRLAVGVPELVCVAGRFHAKPLLPLTALDARYFVLGLSQGLVRVHEVGPARGSRGVAEVNLPADVPRTFSDLTQYDDPEHQLQFHTRAQPVGAAGQRAAVFHGQGVGVDDAQEKKRITEYCILIARGVRKALRAERAPMILAAAEPISAIYRRVNEYPHLVEQTVRGNVDEMRTDELLERVRPIVEGMMKRRRDEARQRYHEQKGTGRVSTDLEKIVPAAVNGQVQALFIAHDEYRWGRYDTEAGQIRPHEKQQPGDEDLLDLAAARAFLTGAEVHVVERSDVPDEAAAAAMFRYLPVT